MKWKQLAAIAALAIVPACADADTDADADADADADMMDERDGDEPRLEDEEGEASEQPDAPAGGHTSDRNAAGGGFASGPPTAQRSGQCPAACLGLPMWQELVLDPAAGPIDSCDYSEYGSSWYLEIVGEGGYASAELDTNSGSGTCTSWSPATGEQTVSLTFSEANACTGLMYFQIDALGPACEDDTPVCGNGVKQAGEQCDGADLDGTTCASNGWTGTLTCSPICTFNWGTCDIPPEEYCGNWSIEGSEQCDGGNLGGYSCSSFGLGDGWLGCSSSCTFDTSSCMPVGYCGNGNIDGSEQCDGGSLGGYSCSSLGLGDGWLGCSSSCTFDTSSCMPVGYCGNGSIDGSEQCDGGNLGGYSCGSFGLGDGWLGCTSSCSFDTSSCMPAWYCGNGSVEGSEQCDGGNLNGYSCTSFGLGDGWLGCSSSCTFDTSSCIPPEYCGNWSIEGSEQCDSGNLNGYSCSSFGLVDGWLGCTSSCTFDTSSCTPMGYCGNWNIEGSEQCDGGNLNGYSCGSFGLGDGWLGCSSSCTFDTSSCTPVGYCGNWSIEGSEQCDAGNLNGYSCSSFGLGDGWLGCSSSCTFDTSSCIAAGYCGDGNIDAYEQCDGGNLGGQSCGAIGLGDGSLGCTPSCTLDPSACMPGNGGGGSPGNPADCGNPSGGPLAWTNGTGIPGEVYCYEADDTVQELAEKACESYFGEGECCIITGGYQNLQYGSCMLDGYGSSLHWHMDNHPEGHCEPYYVVGDVVAPGWCGTTTGNFLPAPQDPNACPAACLELPMWQELVLDPAAGPIESCDYTEYGSSWYLEIIGEGGHASAELDTNSGSGTCTSWSPTTGEQTVSVTFAQANACTSLMYHQIDALGPACEDDTPVCGNGIRQAPEQCDGADLNGKTCADNGWTGTLRCSPICTINWGSCNIPQEP